MSGPRRLVHLGIGAFARAHTLFLTDRAGGYAATVFTGRSPAVAEALTAQGGAYGLVVRGPHADSVELVDVIDSAHAADDLAALCEAVSDPLTSVVTLTITEKGYTAGTDPATSAIARLAVALRARRDAGVQEPIALLPCDNLVGNGDVLRAALLECLDPDLEGWFAEHVDIPSTMVDRITPVAGEEERTLSREILGFEDRATVVTEPFHEWVIEDAFRGERPAWERAGAQFTADVALHERRKLRLLNGAHTYLAYAGQVAGHERVDTALQDPAVREGVEAIWSEARSTLDLPVQQLEEYTAALLTRFENPRLADSLLRIAADGSEKLRVRILPVMADRGGPAESPAGVAAVRAWTQWVTFRVRTGHDIADPRAEQIAAAALIAEDGERVRALVALLGDQVDPEELARAVLAG